MPERFLIAVVILAALMQPAWSQAPVQTSGTTSQGATQVRRYTDDAGRAVDVPARPQRIVSMNDVDVTIPLIELGVRPVASHGRISLDGKPYLRSSAILTGVDFDNSDIGYIGSVTADLEAIVAARPDLIITTTNRSTPVEQLEKIAPTIVIDNAGADAAHIYRVLADITGTQDRLTVLDRRYRAQLKALKAVVETSNIRVSVLQALNGKLSLYHTYRALGRVLRDAGFVFPAIIDAIPPGGRMEVSAERLQELDADFIFDTYRSDTGGSPAEELAEMNRLLPEFCQFLTACRENRYILLPREEAISNSYAALALMVSVVQSHVSGRSGSAAGK